jgi:ABC-2 type transport system ATP-binding protein
VLINHGRIVLDGPLDEVRKRFGGTWRIRATVTDPQAPALTSSALRILERDGEHLLFGPAEGSAVTATEALREVVENYRVVGIAIEESDLEDVMRAAYQRAESEPDDGERDTDDGPEAR